MSKNKDLKISKKVIRIGKFNEQEKQIWASYLARNKTAQ